MATVNIGSVNAGDEFYRYKMPALQSKARRRRRAARRGAAGAQTPQLLTASAPRGTRAADRGARQRH